jgi:hypothetical protein
MRPCPTPRQRRRGRADGAACKSVYGARVRRWEGNDIGSRIASVTMIDKCRLCACRRIVDAMAPQLASRRRMHRPSRYGWATGQAFGISKAAWSGRRSRGAAVFLCRAATGFPRAASVESAHL